MPKEKLPKDIWELYHRYTLSKAIGVTVFFAVLLSALLFIAGGLPESEWLVLHPQNFFSLSAILSSLSAIFFTHFFHRSSDDLLINLLWFIPLGILVFRLEGTRGLGSILAGILFGGVVVCFIGEENYAGFGSAIFACIGILFVRLIRGGWLVLVLFVGILVSVEKLTIFDATVFVQSVAREIGLTLDFYSLQNILRNPENILPKDYHLHAYLGGLLGGMAAQIGLPQIALETLHKHRMVTDEEFTVIATRMYHGSPAFLNPMTAHPSMETAETEVAAEKPQPAQPSQPLKRLRLRLELLLQKAKLLLQKLKQELRKLQLALLEQMQRLRSKIATAKPAAEKPAPENPDNEKPDPEKPNEEKGA